MRKTINIPDRTDWYESKAKKFQHLYDYNSLNDYEARFCNEFLCRAYRWNEKKRNDKK